MTDFKGRAPAPRGSALKDRFGPRVWICFGFVLLAQLLAYCGTQPLIASLTPIDLATPLDARIPLVPAWVTVYFLAYLSWAVSGLLILSESPAHGYRVVCAYALAMLLSAVAFVLWPATIQRPQPVGDDIFTRWVRFVYRVDPPTRLCPSLHVLISYFCWRGAQGCRRIPRWYRWFNLCFLALVCLSVLFVRQHLVVDIPAAVLVAELSLQAARVFRLEHLPLWLERRLRGKMKEGEGGHFHVR